MNNFIQIFVIIFLLLCPFFNQTIYPKWLEANIVNVSNVNNITVIDNKSDPITIKSPVDNSCVSPDDEPFTLEIEFSETYLSQTKKFEFSITDGTRYLVNKYGDWSWKNDEKWTQDTLNSISYKYFFPPYFSINLLKINNIYTIKVRQNKDSNVTSSSFKFQYPSIYSKISIKSDKTILMGNQFAISGCLYITPNNFKREKDDVNIILSHPNAGYLTINTTTDENGCFTCAVSSCNIDHSGLWNIQAKWNGDSSYNIKGSESEVKSISISKGKTDIHIEQLNQIIEINPSKQLTITGKLSLSNNQCKTPSLIQIELVVTDPEGYTQTIQTETKDEGKFEYTIDITKIGQWSIRATFNGNEAYDKSESGITIQAASTVGYAIIVQGKSQGGDDFDSFIITSNYIYEQFKNKKINEENILFIYDKPQLKSKTYICDVSIGQTISKSITSTIIDWARDKIILDSNIYLVFLGHGSSDTFYGSESQALTSTHFSTLINELEEINKKVRIKSNYQSQIVVILGFCNSGSFIDHLKGENRIIISSTGKDENSSKGPFINSDIRNGEFFLYSFFTQVRMNKSIKNCFFKASEQTSNYAQNPQNPLMDDNNNISNDVFVGFQESKPDMLSITETTKTHFLTNEESSIDSLYALIQNTSYTDVKAWIEIRHPKNDNKNLYDNRLKHNNPDYYVEVSENISTWNNIGGFENEGKYQVYYFVKSGNKMISEYKSSIIYKGKKQKNASPYAFHLYFPRNDGMFNAQMNVFDWQKTTDMDNDQITYSVIISKNEFKCESLVNTYPNYDNDTILFERIDSNSLYLTGNNVLKDGTKFYWTVIAIDDYGEKTCAYETRSFKTLYENTEGVCVKGIVSNEFNGISITKGKINVIYESDESDKKVFQIYKGRYYTDCFSKSGCYTFSVEISGYKTERFKIEIDKISNNELNKNFQIEPIMNLHDIFIYLENLIDMNNNPEEISKWDINNNKKLGLEDVIFPLYKISKTE